MGRRKIGLQKNVASIFDGLDMPDVFTNDTTVVCDESEMESPPEQEVVTSVVIEPDVQPVASQETVSEMIDIVHEPTIQEAELVEETCETEACEPVDIIAPPVRGSVDSEQEVIAEPVDDALPQEADPLEAIVDATEDDAVTEALETATQVPDLDVDPAIALARLDEGEMEDVTLEQLVEMVPCEKSLQCYASKLKNLCQARLVRKGKAVECQEPKSHPCSFRKTSLFKAMCKCDIRKHILEKYGK